MPTGFLCLASSWKRISTKSRVSSICLLAWAKRGSSRSKGCRLAKPGRNAASDNRTSSRQARRWLADAKLASRSRPEPSEIIDTPCGRTMHGPPLAGSGPANRQSGWPRRVYGLASLAASAQAQSVVTRVGTSEPGRLAFEAKFVLNMAKRAKEPQIAPGVACAHGAPDAREIVHAAGRQEHDEDANRRSHR
ncbi:hypothetical protein BOS5A_200512 [Bosea sp. EC-HK365B]|nr:hypothetical protein BOSE21B_110457 [Bosea sp. 21B]VVT58291.1 hypothetical protein BOS5A_200512 [Bosea sp. EC-HK365B]